VVAVDLATLQTRRKLDVESSRDLADRVGWRTSLSLSPVAELRPVTSAESPRGFELEPIELLLALGKATAVPTVALASLRIGSLWAVLRYLWAYEAAAAGGPLTLSAATEQVVRHQRTVMSEQFGVAVAAWLYETQIAGGMAEIIDAEWAAGNPFWRQLLAPLPTRLGRWPDYLMYPRATGSPLAVIECKGNSGIHGRGDVEAQLAQGVEQASHPACQGFNPRRVAFCCVTPRGRRRLQAYAVEVRRRGRRGRPIDLPERGQLAHAGDPAKVSWARMLAYAGAYETAFAVYSYGAGPHQPDLERMRVVEGEAIGTSAEVGDATEGVRIFTGVLAPFFDAYRRGDRRSLRGLRALPAVGPGESDERDGYVSFSTADGDDAGRGDSVVAVSNDGAVLAVSLKRRAT
jgi:hypothetical protein